MQRFLVSVATVTFLALGIAACGSSSKSSTPAPTAASTTVTTTQSRSVSTAGGSVSRPAITISSGSAGFAFATKAVAAGSTVMVENLSAAQHTVSADTAAGAFDVTVDAGKTATFTAPSKAGAYRFHCNIHTYMKGTLTVG